MQEGRVKLGIAGACGRGAGFKTACDAIPSVTVQAVCDTNAIVRRAWQTRTVVPGFNIPYLPMMAPVVRALRDTGSFGLIMVARLEWLKFQSGSLAAVRAEYERVGDARHTRLHLDHVPAIDEDNLRVDVEPIFREAVAGGYGSVMVDGSRLPLEENIEVSRRVAEIAHAAGVAVEAELGAVMGHEAGPLAPYEELYASGRGFTDPAEAERFVRETGVDWLSVAIGNIHGAISAAARGRRKVEARLNLDHLRRIQESAHVPLVLHGGTGIRSADVRAAVREGIAKINVGTAIRQPYEAAMTASGARACDAVYREVLRTVGELEIAGQAARLTADDAAGGF
jgi:ketose-bisphosphate aldolase